MWNWPNLRRTSSRTGKKLEAQGNHSGGGTNLEFTFTGADVFDPVPGEGHAHLYVDGKMMTMIYGPEFNLPALEPGTHQVMVTLSTNDHLEYVVDGELLSAMTTVVIEAGSQVVQQSEQVEVVIEIVDGTVSTAGDQIDVDLGSSVVLTVTSEIVEELHVHGYDLRLDLSPDEPATIEFVADIPGVFEVELEGSHQPVLQLRVG